MKIRISFFFQVENVRIYLAVLDIDICGVWHLASDLRFAVMLDGKFIIPKWVIGFKTQEQHCRLGENRQAAETKDANKKQKNITRKKQIIHFSP